MKLVHRMRLATPAVMTWAAAYLLFGLVLSPLLVVVWLRPETSILLLAAADLVLLASGAAALIDHFRSRSLDVPAEDRHRRTARRDAWLLLPALALTTAGTAVLVESARQPVESSWVTEEGRPVEMRGGYKLRMTEDGPWLRYGCRWRRFDCAHTEAYHALPRWPEPDQVVVSYGQHRRYGLRIYGLTVDGVEVIDPKVSASQLRGRRTILVGVSALATLMLAILAWSRLLQVVEHRRAPPKPPLPTLLNRRSVS